MMKKPDETPDRYNPEDSATPLEVIIAERLMSKPLQDAALSLWAKEKEWQRAFVDWSKSARRDANHKRTVLLYQRMQAIHAEIQAAETVFWQEVANDHYDWLESVHKEAEAHPNA